MEKRIDSRLVMRWLPLYELCLYSGSCNRAAGSCDFSQATLNRAHRAIVELLEEAEDKKLRDLLPTLRLTAQKLRTAEGFCRIEVDPFLPVTTNGGDLRIERWLRHKADLSTSLQLLGERISDVFVGSLYELELERSRKLLHFQGKPLVAEALIRTPSGVSGRSRGGNRPPPGADPDAASTASASKVDQPAQDSRLSD